MDGYWRTDDSASGFAYNGRGTIVASKSVILSDSLLYLGDMSNVNADAPKAGLCRSTDRGLCGAADMLGIIAQENIWIGDPSGQIHEVDAVMLAGRDINLVQYAASAATCCDGVTNALTFNGSVLALRGTALARDWADPTPGHQDADCNARSRRAVPSRSSRPTRAVVGAVAGGFLSKDPATGLFAVDTALSGFPGLRDSPGPAALLGRESASDPFPAHDQLRQTAAGTSRADPSRVADQGAVRPGPRLWKDCGSDPKCR